MHIFKNYIWCGSCGFNLFVKSGVLKDGRQILKCSICGVKTRTYCRRHGEKIFKQTELLPFLLKDSKDLNNEELYSLGFLLADGNVGSKGNLQLNILSKDKEIACIIKEALQIPNDIKYYIRSDTQQEVLSLCWQNKYALNYFIAKGLTPNKTGEEVFLPWMSNSHFIRGFFDGDACLFVNKEKHRYELSFTGGSYTFLEDLNNYFKTCCNVSAAKVATQRNKTRDAYRITIYKQGLLKICEYLYKDSEGLRLERKYNKYLEIKNNV